MTTPPPRYSDDSHHGDIELGVLDAKGFANGDKDALLSEQAAESTEEPVSLRMRIFGYATMLVALLGVSSIVRAATSACRAGMLTCAAAFAGHGRAQA